MKRRVAKAPESVRAWGEEAIKDLSDGRRGKPWALCLSAALVSTAKLDHWHLHMRPVRVRIVREADYRRLLRAAAAWKREAKR